MNRQVLGQKYSFPRIVGLSTFSLQVEPKLCGGSDIRWKSTSSAAPESELTQQQDQDCKVDGRRLAGRERKGGMLGETAKDKNEFKGGEEGRRGNDRTFSSQRRNRLQAPVEGRTGRGSQKGKVLR